MKVDSNINIILVGPMGSGKTTVGRKLSERLKKDYQLHLNRKYSITEAVISWFENLLPEKLRKKWFKEPTTDEFFCSKYVNMGFYNIMRLKVLPRLFTPNESFIHWLPKCKVIKYDME